MGSHFVRGDEDNDGPRIGSHALVNLYADYRLSENLTLFARLDNLFDAEYETLGALNRNVFGADGEPLAGELGAVERFVAPGRPRSLFVGVRLAYPTPPRRN